MGEKRDAGREPRPDAVRVVYCIQGGGATSTVKGEKVFVNEDVCYTINTVDVHAVCYSIDHVVTGGATVPHKGRAGIKMFAQL